jgi:tetratricopeptide (TPR) repeat protein
MYARVIAIWEKTGEIEKQEGIAAQAALGEIYRSEGKYDQAEPLLEGALKGTENMVGSDALQIAVSLNNLAVLFYCEGNYQAAEPLYKRVLDIRQKNLGLDNPTVLQTVEIYATLLRQEGKQVDAAKMEAQAARAGVAHL